MALAEGYIWKKEELHYDLVEQLFFTFEFYNHLIRLKKIKYSNYLKYEVTRLIALSFKFVSLSLWKNTK